MDDTDRELRCPWCQRKVTYHIVSGTLRISCSYCRLDGFLTGLPVGTKLEDFESRKTIS